MSAMEIFLYAQVYEPVSFMMDYCNYVSFSGPQARTYSHGHLRLNYVRGPLFFERLWRGLLLETFTTLHAHFGQFGLVKPLS